MQYAKDEIRQRIIDAARQEFFEKGFEKASIRTITGNAKTAKSNLYNYFKDKDDLFCAVLEPTTTKIKMGFEILKKVDYTNGSASYTQEAQKRNIDVVTAFVAENVTDVALLLFKSQGSSLEGFKIKVADSFTDIMCAWVEAMAPGKVISILFIRCISNFYISIVEQAILYRTPVEEVKKAGEEFLKFVYNGWKGIF